MRQKTHRNRTKEMLCVSFVLSCADVGASMLREHSNKKENTKYYYITVVAVVSRVPKMCHVRSFYRNLETITVKQHIKSDGDTEKHTSYEHTKSPPQQRTSVVERVKKNVNKTEYLTKEKHVKDEKALV